MTMKNKMLAGVLGAITILGATFYGGVLYGKKTALPQRAFVAGAGQFRTGAGGARGGGGLVMGQILSTDASSITVKMQDGSTKIILVSDATTVMKSAPGTSADLATGTGVVVTGTQNSDGSVTAQSIQIRPTQTKP